MQRSNPKYIGPGYWASWHIKTLLTDNKEKKSEVARMISIDIENFPCLECKNHAIEYVKNHSLKPAVEDPDPYSLFKWTVNFHNEVNMRLGYPMIDWSQAKKMWSKESFCLEDCGENQVVESEVEKEVDMILRSF